MLTAKDAKNRTLVATPRGTGRLLYWPVSNRRKGRPSPGKRARVELRPGVVVSVDTSDVKEVAGDVVQG